MDRHARLRPEGPFLSAQAEGLGNECENWMIGPERTVRTGRILERTFQAQYGCRDPAPGLRPGLIERAFQARNSRNPHLYGGSSMLSFRIALVLLACIGTA